MPVNSELAFKTWQRYAYARDNGHTRFMEKAEKCERFFQGDQWTAEDRAKLEAVRRPVLTINKIISTISNVMGEQIYNRAETTFRPRSGAPAATADVLTKVYKQISDNNQLDWARSDMFADGIITSRGFLDVRLSMNDSAQGEVCISNLNSKNVIVDPDAEEYDPDKWGEVMTTKWVTADDIAVLYGKEDAELLRNRDTSAFPYGYDSIQMNRDRFGYAQVPMYTGDKDFSNVQRNIRVIERQHRMLDRQRHFMSPETGDMRAIPEDFDRNRIAFFVEKFGFVVTNKLVRRIKWDVIADNVVLHSDWSPYRHFTVVPYFPYFRHGRTIGLVENLLGSQELLNKSSSQELHIVNTSANSGYKVKAGALVGMTPAELESRGAETGLVIEVNGDPDKDIVKITPNAVPSGLDRISYKAEEHIKSISGVSDSMQGFDREDVAAKAIQAKRQAGNTNLVKPMDSLTRTDFILARNVLDIVQGFYTEERLLTITHDEATGEAEDFKINEVDPYGAITNDLTIGEYAVVVSSVPRRETLEDSQFEQAVALREMGVAIPDSVLIDSSRLLNKKDIIKTMEGDKESEEAKAAAELQRRAQEAEVSKAEGEAAQKHADAGLKQAKTQQATVETQKAAQGEPDDGSAQAAMMDAQTKAHVSLREADTKERLAEHQMSIKERELALKMQQSRNDAALKAQDMAQKRMDARVNAAKAAAGPSAKPATAQRAPTQ